MAKNINRFMPTADVDDDQFRLTLGKSKGGQYAIQAQFSVPDPDFGQLPVNWGGVPSDVIGQAGFTSQDAVAMRDLVRKLMKAILAAKNLQE